MAKKTLKLNYSVWRSGGDGPNKTGTGTTALGNKEGMMCVLGQFSLQMDKKMNYSCILDKGTPATLGGPIAGLSEKRENGGLRNTPLAERAMNINDAEHTTPEYKIRQFRQLFKPHGYNIQVTHRPKTTQT